MKEKQPTNQLIVELPELLAAESSIPLPSPEDFPGLLLDENLPIDEQTENLDRAVAFLWKTGSEFAKAGKIHLTGHKSPHENALPGINPFLKPGNYTRMTIPDN